MNTVRPSLERAGDRPPLSDPGDSAGRGCDLCGATRARRVLAPRTLDGPLMRCDECGLYFVGNRTAGLAFGREARAEVAARIRDANAGYRSLARDEERRLNHLNSRWRLDLMKPYCSTGRLLEVGCGRGDFLSAARERFEVFGVEPNPELAADARAEGNLFEGLVADAPWSDFDAAVSFHVIEHVDSPSAFVADIRGRLKPGGLLVLETPDIGGWPYRLMRSRWRQFIPEHYYFFDRRTLARLLGKQGFDVRRIIRVGKYASLGFVANRLSRYLPSIGDWSRPGASRVFRLNPFDIMLVLATRRS